MRVRFDSVYSSQRVSCTSVRYRRRRGGTAKKGSVIAHVRWEVFIMDKYMFHVRHARFSNGIMGLKGTGKIHAVPIGDLALFNVMVKYEPF